MKKKEKKNVAEVRVFDSEIFAQNEIDANKAIGSGNIFTGILLAGALVLNMLYIFISGKFNGLQNILLFSMTGFCMIWMLSTIIWIKSDKLKKPNFKYFLLFQYLAMVSIMNTLLPKHAILGWALMIILAENYYSAKVTHRIYLCTLLAMLMCIYSSMFLGEWDSNLMNGVNEITVAGQTYTEAEMDIARRFQYLAENPDRYWKVFAFYYIPRAGILTVIYQIARLLSLRTGKLLAAHSKEASDKAILNGELQLATGIQNSVLPKQFEGSLHDEKFAMMDPAKEVGGDFYDFFYIDENHLAIVIGDVSGKGIPASLFMMKAESVIKSVAKSVLSDTSRILTAANESLCEGNFMDMFVTCFMGIIDLRNGEMKFTSAGHNPPVVIHDGVTSYLTTKKKCMVLGGFEMSKYQEETYQFAKGDSILLYTDGVTEAHNVDKELYGEPRLLSFMESHKNQSCKEIVETLRKDISAFAGEAPQFDDITMLMVRYLGSSESKEESHD